MSSFLAVPQNNSPILPGNIDLVVISCPQDVLLYKQILATLETCGISVWPSSAECHQGFDSSLSASMINQAPCYVPVMSPQSIVLEAFRDCLSLAYVTSKRIFPLGLTRVRFLRKDMTPGIKIIILAINWQFVRSQETLRSDITEFSDILRAELAVIEREETGGDLSPGGTPKPGYHHSEQERQLKDKLLQHGRKPGQRKLSGQKGGGQTMMDVLPFWLRNFSDKQEEVPTEEFLTAFLAEYGDRIENDYSDRKDWFVESILKKDIFEKNAIVTRETITAFMEPHPDLGNQIYHRIQEYAAGKLAMKSIFSMQSQIRLTVIQNIGQFSTSYVVNRLIKMLSDEDADTRAVAALALGKSTHAANKTRDQIIASLAALLEDPDLSQDRLVRESAVLALGKLQASSEIPRLAHFWRNDAIRDVREAAQLALDKIGGPKVAEVMRVTATLNKEIQYLRQNRPLVN